MFSSPASAVVQLRCRHPRRKETEMAAGPRVLRNFVDGAYVDTEAGVTSGIVDPSTGEVYASAPVSEAVDIDRAMHAAQRGFDLWRDTTPSVRQRALLHIADAIEARADEIVAAESQNT